LISYGARTVFIFVCNYLFISVQKSKNSSESSLGFHRLKLDESENELIQLGKVAPIKVSKSFVIRREGSRMVNHIEPVPCLVGHAAGYCENGFLVFGGARISQSKNVWEGLERITEVPKSSNDLFFLQVS
jgi:hypothetical protein